MLSVLNHQQTIVDHYLRELRDKVIQRDRQRFGHNLETLGMILGYELSKRLDYETLQTETPLGTAATPEISDALVVATVLRAGIPVHRGICTVLPDAEPMFIAAGRRPDTSDGVQIDIAYVAGPGLTGKTLIIADTMLATGHTLVDTYKRVVAEHGAPAKVFIAAVIGSQAGVDYVQTQIPEAELVVCAVDPTLNDDYFIVPGLGDAGDLLYGEKV